MASKYRELLLLSVLGSLYNLAGTIDAGAEARIDAACATGRMTPAVALVSAASSHPAEQVTAASRGPSGKGLEAVAARLSSDMGPSFSRTDNVMSSARQAFGGN